MTRNDDLHTIRRGRAVLELLAEHGMLSTRSLAEFLSYDARLDRLSRILSRLVRRGLVRRSGRGAGSGHEVRYQLSQTRLARDKLSRLLGKSADDLWQGNRRACDSHHEDQCGRLHYYLRKAYPNSQVFRPWNYFKSPSLKSLRLHALRSKNLFPDLIFRAHPRDFSGQNAAHRKVAFVAFEIENSIKSKAKIIQKSFRLGNYSGLDGILYVIPKSEWQSFFLELYEKKSLPEIRRISHYGKRFYGTALFSNLNADIAELPIHFNESVQTLHNWCSYLVQNDLLNRRNSGSGQKQPACL